MACPLCNAINDDYRIIKKTKHSFAIICKAPIKEGHVLVLSKRHVTQNHFSELSPEEMYDFFFLVEELQNALPSKDDEDYILFKNSG